jgi:SAM-dependent methyltransferase
VSTDYDYFDRMYEVPDPWSFETSAYEHRKYALTVAALPRARYRRCFEPGCSIGVLSERLADTTDELVAVDLHPGPVERARERLAGRAGVTVDRLTIPDEWPSGTFDLIVLSEVAYYFDDRGLRRLVERVTDGLEPGGDLVLVHWRGPTDYPQTGDEVHDMWSGAAGFEPVVHHVEESFRLDVLRSAPIAERG